LSAIDSGRQDACDITGRDARVFLSAKQSLVPPADIDVDVAARIVLEASKILGSPGKIIDAARYYAAANPDFARDEKIPAIVSTFIRAIEVARRSDKYVRTMRNDLARFAARFPGPILEVKEPQISQWIIDAKVGIRRTRNLRDAVITLFNFARENLYLPSTIKTEAEKVKRQRVAIDQVLTYTPAELKVLLECALPRFIPVILLGAFAGLRMAEIYRMDWSAIRWEQSVIEVRASQAKTRRRRLVPLLPNLAAWLAPYRGQFGPIFPDGRNDLHVDKLRENSGIIWKRNALRHSFISYRVASVKNLAQVALEAGNSPNIIQEHYLELATEEEAKTWFALPDDKIIPLDLKFVSQK
jgi:integrase